MVRLLFGCCELIYASGSMSEYVFVTSHNSSVWENISGEHSCAVPGLFSIFSVDK